MRLTLFACLLLFFHNFAAGQNSIITDAKSLSDSAIKLLGNNEYDSALSIINKAIAISQKNNDSLQTAKCLNNIGLIYSSKGDPVKSLFYYEQSLKLLRQLNNKEDFPTALLNIGISYKEQGIYDRALKNLFEAVAFFELRGEAKKLSSAYNAIGNINRIEGNYNWALEYHTKALKLRQSINYTQGVAASLSSIGVVYKELGKYDSALFYLGKSLASIEVGKTRDDHYANTLSHIAEIYEIEESYPNAKKYFDSAYAIRKKNDSKKGIAYSLFELGRLYYSTNEHTKAETYLLRSIDEANNVKAFDIVLNAYEILRKLYKSKKNYIKAILYDDLFIKLNMQLLGEEKQKSLTQMQIKYETEKKQEEIDNLNQDKQTREAILQAKEAQLESKRVHNQNLVIVIVSLTLILTLVLVLFVLRLRYAKKLDIVMRELHHRVKNNFQVLLSLFNLQLEDINDEEAKKVIASNSNRITAMMLIHRKLYFDKEITTVKVADYIQNIVENLLVVYGLKKRGIEIKYTIDDKIKISVDNAISLGLLVNELVTNSFKYAFDDRNKKPLLFIELTKNKNNILLVQDNCTNSTEVIFKNSFGLKLVNTQVKLLKGNLQRTTDNGIKYTIVF